MSISRKYQVGFGVVEVLAIIAVIAVVSIVGFLLYARQQNKVTSTVATTTNNATPTKNTEATPKTSKYADTAMAYTVSYPKDWTNKQVPSNNLSQVPLLDQAEVRFAPTSLPPEAIGNTWVGITSYKSGDLQAVLDAKSGTKSLTINGYKALYYQVVASATAGSNGAAGSLGYTDDYYAVTDTKTTLVFYFREKQDGNGIAKSFDASTIVPAYTALVKSVKFTN